MTATRRRKRAGGSKTSWRFNHDLIKTRREELGLTVTAFGRLFTPPMGGAQIRDLEEGKRDLMVGTLLRMASFLDIKPGDFFAEQEP
jgi:hypothetical protein